jgi:hypothetical protein
MAVRIPAMLVKNKNMWIAIAIFHLDSIHSVFRLSRNQIFILTKNSVIFDRLSGSGERLPTASDFR